MNKAEKKYHLECESCENAHFEAINIENRIALASITRDFGVKTNE